MRKLAERLLRRVVVRRRIPGGPRIYLAADACLGYLRPRIPGQELFALARDHVQPGDTVWDVGANCGVFAFAAAARGASVLAIEADVDLACLMHRSRRKNPQCDVSVLPVAVSSKVGFAEFSIARRGRASNSLSAVGRSQAGGTREVRHVPMTTLDQLLDTFGPPSMVKIDVEGSEVEVLYGAMTLLEDHHPTIYCEVGRETHSECRHLLEASGYTVTPGRNMLAQYV